MKHFYITVLAALMLCVILTGCQNSTVTDISPSPTETSTPQEAPVAEVTTPASTPEVSATPDETPEPAPPLVPEYEIYLVAKTLRGECYDEQHDDKREVVRVICNRVSVVRGPDGERFGDSIEAVITAPRQFAGYRPDNKPTANDFEIACEILTEWYEGGCKPLSNYLFFSAGSGHINVFREKY